MKLATIWTRPSVLILASLVARIVCKQSLLRMIVSQLEPYRFHELLEDLLGIFAVLGAARLLYCVLYFSISEWKGMLFDMAYQILLYIPAVRRAQDQQIGAFRKDLVKMLGKNKTTTQRNNIRLPKIGISQAKLLADLQKSADSENKHWKAGKVSGTVYYEDDDRSSTRRNNDAPTTTTNNDDLQSAIQLSHPDFMSAVYKIYVSANPLHPGCWPTVNQCEAEIINMVGQLLHFNNNNNDNGPYGTMTSGGTESVICSVRAYHKFYHNRRAHFAEIICASTAHASLFKACEIFRIRPVIVDCSQPPFRLSARDVEKRITCHTIMVFVSACCYPQGTVDDIESIARVAQSNGIGCHVDACLGGFVLAFCDDAPKFDFQCPGVTSMSIDTHKYGYASKGTSVVLYRHNELRHAQYFSLSDWSGGLYVTPTFAGSRPGALSVCAWASLMSLGMAGYRKKAERIVRATRKIAAGIDKLPYLKLMTPYPQFMVVCFGSNELDIYRVKDVLATYGWSLNDLQKPASVHLCVTQSVVNRADEFLVDLERAVETVHSEGPGNKKGTAGIYGAVGNIPKGPVEYLLNVFTDLTLTP